MSNLARVKRKTIKLQVAKLMSALDIIKIYTSYNESDIDDDESDVAVTEEGWCYLLSNHHCISICIPQQARSPYCMVAEHPQITCALASHCVIHWFSSYQLSKHLSFLLSPLVGISTSYMLRTLSTLSNQSPSLVVGPDELMVSYNVVSLFTNVPVDLACRVAEQLVSAG